MTNMDDDWIWLSSKNGWLKPIIITNFRYVTVKKEKTLSNLLKHLQYYDGRMRRQGPEVFSGSPGEAPPHPKRRSPTWVNRGLGETYQEILQELIDLRGRSLLARTWVISPDPDLMQYIPKGQEADVICRITENIIEQWCEDNDWYGLEYSYVNNGWKQSGDWLPHSHVVTPGTYPVDSNESMLGRWEHYVKRPHIFSLQQVSSNVFEEELKNVLGEDRAMRLLQGRNEWLVARERYVKGDRDQEWLMQKYAECWPDPISLIEEIQREKKLAEEEVWKNLDEMFKKTPTISSSKGFFDGLDLNVGNFGGVKDDDQDTEIDPLSSI